jgi:hypothetical protein
MKQTAIEFLKEQLDKILIDNQIQQTKHLFEQAKEMEKQQIENAFQYKFFHPYVENEPETYYNETYKK